MKKIITALAAAILTLCAAFSLIACNKKAEVKEKIEITVLQEETSVADDQLNSFVYTNLFKITGNGKNVTVKDEYIDLSNLKAESGRYEITCTYKKVSATAIIVVYSANPAPEYSITIDESKLVNGSLFIDSDLVDDYDFTKLFFITENGKRITTPESAIDKRNLLARAGRYSISCRMGEAVVHLTVNVTAVDFEVEASVDEITLHVSQVAAYDYTKLFAATRNGQRYQITADKLNGLPSAQVGEYTVTLELGEKSASVRIKVQDKDVVVCGTAFDEIRLPAVEVASYDFSNVFYIYVNGISVAIDEAKIDASALENAVVDGDPVKVWYRYGDDYKFSVDVYVITDDVVITSRNAEILTNSAQLDLTALFEITRNGETLPVTNDMVSGEVDYGKVGDYTITLTYRGRTRTATVTVRTGLVIEYEKGETVEVKQGANKDLYDFTADFRVIANGITFTDIGAYLNADQLAAIDFSTAGEYELTLRIPYNNKSFGVTGVKFDYIEKTIKYVVVARKYTYSAISDVLTVKVGETVDLAGNINLVIDGIKQNLSTDRSAANIGCCYYEIATAPDNSLAGTYRAVIRLYVYGVDADPVEVEMRVKVIPDVTVEGSEVTVFVGSGVYTPDLFAIYENGKSVYVSLDMIDGEFDPFEAGIYELTLNYKDVEAKAIVYVVDRDIVGSYSTPCMTQAVEGETDDSGDPITDGTPAKPIGDLEIDENLNVTFKGKAVTDVKCIGENKFSFKESAYAVYEFEYVDGVIFVTYVNDLRMQLTDSRRPLVYVKNGESETQGKFFIHSSKSGTHVLSEGNVSKIYTIENYKVKFNDGAEKWYSLYICLKSYMGQDYNYEISYGEAVFPEDFAPTANNTYVMTLNGVDYSFVATSSVKGIISKSDSSQTQYDPTGKTFTGGIDNAIHTLAFRSGNGSSLKQSSNVVYDMYAYDISSMKITPYDSATKTYRVYGEKVISGTEVEYYSSFKYFANADGKEIYPFSYRFVLDFETNKFTCLAKDKFYGLYSFGNSCIFFDGYGTGAIRFGDETVSNNITGFNYTVNGNTVNIEYFGVSDSFAHGKKGTLALNNDGNSYTVMNLKGIPAGAVYSNVRIEKGYVVNVSRFVFKTNETKTDLVNSITIYNKSGEVTGSKKTALIVTKYVAFNTPGIYEITINKVPYAVQIIDKRYSADDRYVKDFGSSLDESATLSVDEYGYATLTRDGVAYTGAVTIGEKGFTGKLYCDSGYITLEAEEVYEGVLSVTVNGVTELKTEFIMNSSVYAGNSSIVIRKIVTSDGADYYLCSSAKILGEKIDLEFVKGTDFIAGSEIKITTASGTVRYFYINSLSDGGLVENDGLGGSFVQSDNAENTLETDGYGNAEWNGVTYEYTYLRANRDYIFIETTVNGTTKLYKFIVYTSGDKAGKFDYLGEVLTENDLINGGTYSYTQVFSYEEGDEAVISFKFAADGKVTISVKSNEDSPAFVGVGSYTIEGATVKVTTANGKRITFELTSYLSTNSLKVVSSDTTESEDIIRITRGNIFTAA